MIKKSSDFGPVLYPIPTSELERRWGQLRSSMDKAGLDMFIVQNEGQDLGGYIRWLTDNSAGYPVTVIFQKNAEMVVINSGDPQFPGNLSRGVGLSIVSPYFRTLRTTENYDAKIVHDYIKKSGQKRIGIVNLGRMHACFYKYLTENLPDVVFVDFTDEVDLIKAVKSPAEMVYIKETIWLHDKIMEAMPTIIRPGRLESDLRNDIYKLSCEMGGEGQIVLLIGSGPIGTQFGYGPMQVQNRRIDYGDCVMVMLESSGPGGFFAEMSRYWCLGEPDYNLIRGWEVAKNTQHIVAERLKPGADLAWVFGEANKYLLEEGFYPEGRVLGHGQGYDLVERPGIISDEIMPAVEGMVFAIHPSAIDANVNVFCCDNYIVTSSGGERLQKFPQDLIIL